jgi:hypothetical protein
MMIDVRCTARQADTAAGTPVRCQLLAGHEGAHAVMFCQDGRRTVRTWRGRDGRSVEEHRAGQETRPWALGMPQPAWSQRH